MSAKNIYLHVGLTKTGSSSLQLYLRSQNETLKSNGWLYPDSPNGHMSHFPYIFNPVHCDKLIKIIKQSEQDNIIISDENLYRYFWNPSKGFISRLSQEKDFNLKVILYVRRQDEWFNSIYIQYISQWEHRYTCSDEVFMLDRLQHLNYLAICDWFKSNNCDIELISYDDQICTGVDTIQMFCDQILKIKELETNSRTTANPSVTAPIAFMLREINSRELINDKSSYIKTLNYLKSNFSSYTNNLSLCRKTTLEKIIESQISNNRILVAKYGSADKFTEFLTTNIKLIEADEKIIASYLSETSLSLIKKILEV